MELHAHWEQVYRTKPSDSVSWYQPHLQLSFDLIRRVAADLDTPIVDVGGGASTLVDDLVAAGYSDVTVLDLAETALDIARARLGPRSSAVTWIAGDVTRVDLPARRFAVWHDRAVFHFLTDPADRDRYVAQVRHALRPGGYAIVASFGPEGPQRCSGLPTTRYDAAALHAVFGPEFDMLHCEQENHHTPAGTEQQFVYCL
jgi:SAM-dependent methyltransferase